MNPDPEALFTELYTFSMANTVGRTSAVCQHIECGATLGELADLFKTFLHSAGFVVERIHIDTGYNVHTSSGNE